MTRGTNELIQVIHSRLFLLLILFLVASAATAQTTEFTYQGRLLEGTLPPTANYDFEFRLFAVDTGGTAMVLQQHL